MEADAAKVQTQEDPDALDRLVLRLGSERVSGGVGRDLAAVRAIADEHGFGAEAVLTCLEILEHRRWIHCAAVRGDASPLDFGDTRITATPEGKDRLRHLEATTQFNVRPPAHLLEELRRLTRSGQSATALAVRALTEWVRMENFPGIDFRWTPSGRQPHVTGTGLTAWEMFRVWLEHDESTARVLESHPHLSAVQVEAGVAYAREFQDEMPPGWGTRPPFAREFPG